MKKNKDDQEKLRREKVSAATKQMMEIMCGLPLSEALDAYVYLAAFYIETCGSLGLDADEVEETMCRGMHMVRKDVRAKFDRLRSKRPEDSNLKDRAEFEAKYLEHKMCVEHLTSDFLKKNPGVLHASITDLKKKKLIECFSTYKKLMEMIREISPQVYHDKFEVSMEYLDRECQMVEHFEKKRKNKEEDNNLS